MSIAMEDTPRRHRISVDEYHRMAKVGLLAPDARVELIEGEIIDMPSIGSRHAAVVDRLNRLLNRVVGEQAIVRCQAPIRLGEFSEPQPDIALLAYREDFYEQHLPTASDTLLVIEVSETTLRYDRHTKVPLYARHAVPEVWIVNTVGKQVEVFRNLSGADYASVFTAQTSASMSIDSLPGVAVDLSALIR